MHRYNFLTEQDVYAALNRLRASFLAAKDGYEVEEIIKGVLTHDERMKVGRRILIAQLLQEGYTFESISKLLKVGKHTITKVQSKYLENPDCFTLINRRVKKVETVYKEKAYQRIGGSKLIFKPKKHTGFRRKDVER